MNQVLTIAGAAILEHRRRKLVAFFLVVALAVAAGLIYISLNEDLGANLMNAAVGLATVASVGLLPALTVLAAIAVSMNNVGRPFGDGEAALILARPVARWQFVLGRFLGSVGVVAGLCVVMASIATLVGLIGGSDFNPDVWGHWGVTAVNLSVLAAIVTLMSALFGNPLLAAFTGYIVYASSTAVSALYLLVDTGRVTGVPGALITLAWFITPKRLLSPLSEATANEQGITTLVDSALLPGNGVRLVWALTYAVVALALSFVIAERKEAG